MSGRYDLLRAYLGDSGAGENLARLLTGLIAEAEAHERDLTALCQVPPPHNGTPLYRCSTSEREWFTVGLSEEDFAAESIFVQTGRWTPDVWSADRSLLARGPRPVQGRTGDPCASCGSCDTGYEITDGATCNACGRTDADA